MLGAESRFWLADNRDIDAYLTFDVANIGPKLTKKIPDQNMSPLDFMSDHLVNIYFCPKRLIQKSARYWTPWRMVSLVTMKLEHVCLLKQISQCIVDPLTHVCNLSLIEGIFPHWA